MIIREEQIPQFTKFPDCSRYMSGDVSAFQTNALDFYKVFRSGDGIQCAFRRRSISLMNHVCPSQAAINRLAYSVCGFGVKSAAPAVSGAYSCNSKAITSNTLIRVRFIFRSLPFFCAQTGKKERNTTWIVVHTVLRCFLKCGDWLGSWLSCDCRAIV